MNEYTLWIAEAGNGSIQFDTAPSKSDVLNVCEDLVGTIEVFEVRLSEVSREMYFTVEWNIE